LLIANCCLLLNLISECRVLTAAVQPTSSSFSHSNIKAGCRGLLITILIIILVLMLIGALPSWPHSRNWGYRPVGGLGLILVIVLILYLLNYI
jgi:VIT1/CCC1 family predicted Fe2+/Mn2+ transporter